MDRVSNPPEKAPSFLLDPKNEAQKIELNDRVLNGDHLSIVYPGVVQIGDNSHIPIFEPIITSQARPILPYAPFRSSLRHNSAD